MLRRTPCKDGQLDYNPKEVFRLYIGLNDANVKEALERNKDIHEYLVEKVDELKLKTLIVPSYFVLTF